MNMTITRQMIAVDILKLRRQRAVMITAAVLTVGVCLAYYGITIIRDGFIPGARAVVDGTDLMGVWFGSFAAILIGAEAGSIDRANGVFRDLAATGRSRIALFLTRVPAAAVVALVFALSGFLISLIVAFTFRGSTPVPSARLVFGSLGWLVLSTVVVATLAVGIGTLIGSRSVTLTLLIGFQTIGALMIAQAHFLGSLRDVLLPYALGDLRPGAWFPPADLSKPYAPPISYLPDYVLPMGFAVGVLVIIAWVAIPAILGAYRTSTVDA